MAAYFRLYPDGQELVRIVNRLNELAPAVMRWRRLPEPRGPMPDIHPDHRDEFWALDAEGKALIAARKAKKEGPPQPPRAPRP